jgi:hypothetical protein
MLWAYFAGMSKVKSIAILGIIILSLLPVYLLYKYLQQVIRPKESMRRFMQWMLIMFIIIFAYTFLLVFVIRLLFPGA